ncbi:MAG: hypothetical protein WC825_05735 [Gallionellaceae bacterium]|jgi:iron complex outermembrane receptor protein
MQALHRQQFQECTTLNMTVRTIRDKSQWDFAASVRNLFNADAREPSLAPGTAIPTICRWSRARCMLK